MKVPPHRRFHGLLPAAGLAGLLVLAGPAWPQRAMLRLDTAPGNRCVKNGEGGLWILQDNSARNRLRPEVYVLTVTVRVLPLRTVPPYSVVRYLHPGASAELGCAQGVNGANYQIESER